VQCSGPHWTINSSTQVDRRPCRTRLGLLRAVIRWMVALSPGASLPRRGSTAVACRRLWVAHRRGTPCLPFVGRFSTMRSRNPALASARVTARCESALSMESCLVTLSTASGDIMFGREPQSGSKIIRQRGAIGLSSPFGQVSFWQSDSQ